MSRPLDNMLDVKNAKRLLVLWVPRAMSRWKRGGWGMCLGRLWLQWTPKFDNTLDTPYESPLWPKREFWDLSDLHKTEKGK